MEIDYISIDNYTGWVNGLIYKGKEAYEFQARIMDDPNKYGIHKGRITKLWIFPKGDRSNWLVNYDRGWDVRPSFGFRKVYTNLLNELEEFQFPQ